MPSDSRTLVGCAGRGAVHGTAAWAAYAVVEFVFSSLLYAFTRHYASLSSWHWQLTALLMGAYLLAGALAGAVAGSVVWALLRRGRIRNADDAAVLENAATMTLVIAFAANVLLIPLSPAGKYVLFAAAAAFVAGLAAAIRSPEWSRRLGFLTNAWVVAGILLGLGQEFGLTELHDQAAQFGAKFWLWAGLLTAVLFTVGIGSVVAGRRWASRFARGRLTLMAPGWAALALASAVLAASAALARQPVDRAAASAAIGGPSARPNVLIIVLDTVRADHLSVYGYPRKTAPNLDLLAKDSMLYTNAIAPSDTTLTSHASLFTGVYPGWHGAYCNPPGAIYGKPISNRYQTLAEVLAAKGYATYGVSANVYLREEFGSQRGFEWFRIPRPVPVLASENWYLLRVGMRRALSYFVDTAQFDRLFARGEDVGQELFAMFGSHPPQDRPFFAFLNYMDAHYPYVPPAPFDRMFPGKQYRMTQDDMDRDSERVVHGAPMPAADRSHRISQYDGGIRYDDEQIGRVLDWLKRHGAYENTLIVVASDHGEAFGEKGLVLHGNSAYQDLLHVALMIRFPGNTHRGVVHDPVSLVDVFPTVMDALGYPAARTMQGQNLLAARSGARELYSESFPCPVIHPPDCPNGCTSRSVFSWPQKYITSSNGKRELYDLAGDPAETRNLYERSRQAAETLGDHLSAWLKTAPVDTGQKSVVDQESVNRLKSLGYVQ